VRFIWYLNSHGRTGPHVSRQVTLSW
jgi:hypothetical protein